MELTHNFDLDARMRFSGFVFQVDVVHAGVISLRHVNDQRATVGVRFCPDPATALHDSLTRKRQTWHDGLTGASTEPPRTPGREAREPNRHIVGSVRVLLQLAQPHTGKLGLDVLKAHTAERERAGSLFKSPLTTSFTKRKSGDRRIQGWRVSF